MIYPEISRLIGVLQKLPLIGPKTSEKIAYFLINSDKLLIDELVESIKNLKENLTKCSICFGLTSVKNNPCNICLNSGRDNIICVVEDFTDQIFIESSGVFNGKYHILEGLINPVEGKVPDRLRIRELLDRIKEENIREIVFAIPSSIEGDVTVEYISSKIREIKRDLILSRFAVGIPAGSEIENIDKITLLNAINNRKKLE